MKTRPDLKSLFDQHGGLLRTKDLYANRYFYEEIRRLILEGIIEKIRYGYYRLIDDENFSEAPVISGLFPDGILCMYTALLYYRYSDRDPHEWHIAVSKDSGKSRFRIAYPFVQPYFIEPSILELGLTTGDIDGNPVRIYDKERTICDCLRNVNKMDSEVFNKAILNFVNDHQKSIPRFAEYAKIMRLTKKARTIVGVWL
jgi:predicted transcriptional regulator of viral defense system